MFLRLVPVAAALVLAAAADVSATDWFVAPNGAGNGTSAAPFGSIQQAVNAAQPGDRVIIRPGTYVGLVRSVRSGTATTPITLRSEQGRGSVVVTTSGRVLQVDHAALVVEGLVFDGQYGGYDTLDINAGAHGFTLRDSEVRRSGRDCIDMASPQGVTIEGALVHHCLNAANGRTDAHGIVAGAVRDLTIRDSEIHTFSGDGVQVDPGRAAPGWDRVTIEGTTIWQAPLPAAENGFPAGALPAENAVDTKSGGSFARARLVIRDVVARGFRSNYITNAAAFNLKENIEALVDRVTVSDSEIAFRTRGPGSNGGAHVTIQNAVVHDVTTAVRYEDNIEVLRVRHATIGFNVGRAFQAASSTATGLEVRNMLLLASQLPGEATHASNLAVTATTFLDAASGDYHLVPGAAAIDRGVPLADVAFDRDGLSRPAGAGWDSGAYEYRPDAGPGDPALEDIVIHARRATALAGAWSLVPDDSAAGGARVESANAGLTIKKPLASPAHYFEVTFTAQAGVEYRVWLRGLALNDRANNDSAFLQFTDSVAATGAAAWRIGSTSALTYTLSECRSCPLSGWGWEDTGFGTGVLGPTVRFATGGTKRLRVQVREDGLAIDQVVLSPLTYLQVAPGAVRGDTTVLPEN
ncbi:MAG: hypothetical protein KJ061_03425 [Vicinamibacteraceae bacterium]|nr:hypothetical protein [Vicinamibacteraceae bacterium]